MNGRLGGGIALTAALVVGLALAGCGDSSTTTIITTTPTTPGAGVPPTGAASARTFAGSTSQGLQISFTVLPGAVRSVEFDWRARCADGEVHVNTISLPGGPLQAGAFSTGGTLNTGGYSRAAGKVDGDSAAGTLSRSGSSAFNTNCQARGVTWRAHAVSP